MPAARIVIFTRYPTAGQAKTRLIPALGPEGAAALHRRLTERSLAAARGAGLPCEIRSTGASIAAFKTWLGDAVPVIDQGEGDLGERLRLAGPPYPTIFIGTDAPDLSAALLRDAAVALAAGRAVIGPAEDGGYWLLGLPGAQDAVFTDMPWSTNLVCGETRRKLAQAGITAVELPTLADCDRPEDLARWPELVS